LIQQCIPSARASGFSGFASAQRTIKKYKLEGNHASSMQKRIPSAHKFWCPAFAVIRKISIALKPEAQAEGNGVF
jgi:hypothetical protein